MLAIIGGTGLTELANLEVSRRQAVRTPYGEPSGSLTFGTIRGVSVMFLARHGDHHTIAPHQVNYRANLWALKEQGASEIVSVVSVGGIRRNLGPGKIVVPHQIIDYTWGRMNTFFENESPVRHIDFTEPYTGALRARLLRAAEKSGEAAVDGAVYAATQGPRLETAAEIDRLEKEGADIVGMTGMPEAGLAREIGLAYAAIAVVVNHAAGRGDSARGIQLQEIEAVLKEAMSRVRKVIGELVTA
ncbi:MAG TPA: S-methyl-5'-thioinosine phosphorylase [Burkholderiales bacterium]|jgi:5'-methylthioadenosine phosphorylase|nr:S-methyl-5'-thioinosine phosphorylase [Burkholderiales bacterium]